MSNIQNTQKATITQHTAAAKKVSPTWWLVLRREVLDLWIGGKALNLMLIYSIILGVMVYVYSFNSELSLIPPKEATYEMLKNAMSISLFIGLVIGADALSGERDRGTLESLLLTPTSRRQIMVGKFLGGLSQWPVAFLIALPFMKVLSQGDDVYVPAIVWGAITGTMLAIGYTGVGMLVSFWSTSNKTSYFISLGIYILFLVPAQLPGRAQTGAAGQFLQWVNPLAAVNHFLSKHLVNYRPVIEYWTWLESPAVFALLIIILLFFYAAPGLRLEAGRKSKLLARFVRPAAPLLIAGLLVASLAASPVLADQREQQSEEDLQISIDADTRTVKTGDTVEYNTTVTNNGAETSPPLIVAMNVINLDAKGDVVDPEDWSPQRTQYIDSLASGESASLHWVINTILDGDYMVYMVLIPAPTSRETTSHPIASSGIHLTVTPFTRLNPGGVLPYVIGAPVLLLAIIYFVYRRRQKQIDMGGS
ncbi:MAG TPA: ABC transporter permease subunit [Anaerolineales bacterium]|nr:ABC transporter permease subunit [Anaerolineales bacterium]